MRYCWLRSWRRAVQKDSDKAESGLTPFERLSPYGDIPLEDAHGPSCLGIPRYIRFTEVAEVQSVTLYVLWTAKGGVG